MAVAVALGLERPTPRLAASVSLITLGVMAASYGEGRFSAAGVAAMVASVAAEALRLNITQLLMARRGLHPLEALSYLAPACAFWMLLPALFTDIPRLAARGLSAAAAARPGAFAASAAAGFAVNFLAFGVVALSSALTLKVLAICKDVGVVLFGAAVLHEAVARGQFAGYAVSVAGVAWYNYVKATEPGLGAGPAGGGGAAGGGVVGGGGVLGRLAAAARRAAGGGGGGGGKKHRQTDDDGTVAAAAIAAGKLQQQQQHRLLDAVDGRPPS